MKKGLIITVIALIGIFLLGAVLIVVGIFSGGTLDFNIDYGGHRVRNGKETSFVSGEMAVKEFDSFDIDVSAAKVSFVEGDDYKVTYKLIGEKDPDIEVSDSGELKIKSREENGFSFNLGDLIGENGDDKNVFIELQVPKGKSFKDSKINANAGDINVDGHDFENLTIEANAGNVGISNSKLNELSINANAGNINLKSVDANKIDLSANAGNLGFDKVNASEVKVDIDYGEFNVTNSELTKLDGQLDAGNAELTDLKVSNLKMDLDYGDLEIGILGEAADYAIKVDVDYGNLTVDGKSENHSYSANSGKDKSLDIESNAGDVTISFK